MHVDEIGLDEWADALPAEGVEVFHQPEALRVLDAHTAADMRLFAGYKGDQPVGLFPAFVRDNSVGRAVFSPPPSAGVPRLGPLLMSTSPKRRKQESENTEFVDLVLDQLDAESRRTLFRTECPLSYADPRPFAWADMAVEPTFTYVVDLADTTAETVLRECSKSLRREIRNGEDGDVEIGVEGLEGALRVYRDVVSRYEAQDEDHPFSVAYFRDVVTALDDRCRTYVARTPAGEYLGGIVVLYAPDHASFWQGGTRADYGSVSVNSLLHWRIITDVLADEPFESVTGYDLVGANTPRLSKYKAKFGGRLAPYYAVESAGPEMTVAKKAYELLP